MSDGDLAQRKKEIEAKLRALRSTEVTTAPINGVLVETGVKITVRQEAGVLEHADKEWAKLPPRSSIQYRLDEVYKGEKGIVMKLFENYQGKEGLVAAELRFVDDSTRVFVGQALEVGDFPPMPKPFGAKGKENANPVTSSKPTPKAESDIAEVEMVAPPVKWPTHKPGRGPVLVPKCDVVPTSLSDGEKIAAKIPAPSSIAAKRVDQIPAASPTTPWDLARSDSAFFDEVGRDLPSAESSIKSACLSPITAKKVAEEAPPKMLKEPLRTREAKHADPTATLKGSLPLKTITAQAQSRIPSCPSQYKGKHTLGEASRIPRLGGKRASAAVTPPKKSTSSAMPIKSQPPAGAARLPRVATISPTPNHTRTAKRKASLTDDTLPAEAPPKRSTAPLLRHCTVSTMGNVHGDEDVKAIVVRESHTSLAAVLTMCTRELGWGGRSGMRVERLFRRDSGEEVNSPSQIEDGMSLVATAGPDYRPTSKKSTPTQANVRAKSPVRKAGGAATPTKSAMRHGTPTPTKSSTRTTPASSPVAAKVTAATKTRETSPGRCMPRSTAVQPRGVLSLKVYVNGDYGDSKGNQYPESRVTVTIRPTHKTMASVLNTITRSLQWHTMGRKVEVLYDASGGEIASIGELVDGTSIVASSGDRFVVPLASSLLYKDLMNQTGGSPPPSPAAQPVKTKEPVSASIRTTTTTNSRNIPLGAPGNRINTVPVPASHTSEQINISKTPGGPTPSSGSSATGRAQQLMDEIKQLEHQLSM